MKNIERKYDLIAALIPFAFVAANALWDVRKWDTGSALIVWLPKVALSTCLNGGIFGLVGAIVYGIIRFFQKLIYPAGKPMVSLIIYIIIYLTYMTYLFYMIFVVSKRTF